MPTEIRLEPNYESMFQRFLSAARGALQAFEGRQAEGFTRKEVYEVVSTLRIAVNSLTKSDQIVELRAMLDESGNAMFARLNKDHDDDEEEDEEDDK